MQSFTFSNHGGFILQQFPRALYLFLLILLAREPVRFEDIRRVPTTLKQEGDRRHQVEKGGTDRAGTCTLEPWRSLSWETDVGTTEPGLLNSCG